MLNKEKIEIKFESDLESFDRFMTAQKIDGENFESPPKKELDRIEQILEAPLPNRIVQTKLLEHHKRYE
jgi:hypothetical protein